MNSCANGTNHSDTHHITQFSGVSLVCMMSVEFQTFHNRITDASLTDRFIIHLCKPVNINMEASKLLFLSVPPA